MSLCINNQMRVVHRRRLYFVVILSSDLYHPAGTSKDSDICDLSNISDMKICIVGNGNIHIFKHPAYLSKDLGEIYIYIEKFNKVWRSDIH